MKTTKTLLIAVLVALAMMIIVPVNAQRCAVLEFKAGGGDSQSDCADCQNEHGQKNMAEEERQEIESALERAKQERLASLKAQGYVDLGLPSGTMWKDKNEDGGFYTCGQALSKYGNKLPTKEQFDELINSCDWSWIGSGYKVVGPSGESIIMSAEGGRFCDGGLINVGSCGYYWSSTLKGSDRAWRLFFNSDEVEMGDCARCCGRSVRLVDKP